MPPVFASSAASPLGQTLLPGSRRVAPNRTGPLSGASALPRGIQDGCRRRRPNPRPQNPVAGSTGSGVAWLTHPLPRRFRWLTVASRTRCSDSADEADALWVCADCQHKLTCRIDDEGVLADDPARTPAVTLHRHHVYQKLGICHTRATTSAACAVGVVGHCVCRRRHQGRRRAAPAKCRSLPEWITGILLLGAGARPRFQLAASRTPCQVASRFAARV